MERVALMKRLCMRPPTTHLNGASNTPADSYGDYACKEWLERDFASGLLRFFSAIDHAAVMRYGTVCTTGTFLELAMHSPFTEKGDYACKAVWLEYAISPLLSEFITEG